MHTSISTIIWILALLRPVAISVAIEFQEPLQQIKKLTDPSSFHDCRQNVPGDSPAHYNGDPKDDILTIEKLDLIPNPPDE